jgi:hypothetical protein
VIHLNQQRDHDNKEGIHQTFLSFKSHLHLKELQDKFETKT